MLNCLMLQMPPLRSHLQDIPRLSGLYISTLNMRNARAVIGFEPEANLCMTEYSWPGNYDQFCRVLDERLANGDELALHGYFHQDDGAAPRTPGDWPWPRASQA